MTRRAFLPISRIGAVLAVAMAGPIWAQQSAPSGRPPSTTTTSRSKATNVPESQLRKVTVRVRDVDASSHTVILEAHVRRLTRLAADGGLDGVVASPHEIAAVRQDVARPTFLVVTPGVRPADAPHDDQKRVLTPAGAVRAGADFVVVGRAILNSHDPARAARAVVEEMENVSRQ